MALPYPILSNYSEERDTRIWTDASFRSSASLRTPLSMTNSTLDCNLVLIGGLAS
ncbi:hypothetical protein [Coleofasciculus chthonoplastes]|uniref:hypothetical protein n=1 Tax=Coleofasciculus chthonoplastes TaxID=64178 RepID=UPI0012FC9BD4|nr:hypothetical protein [Coleofasciculus chthonoplastes]